ncbi:hypothetical protein GCM10007301_10530 [Azorhizobium oxalatiphilum]|uniref:Uncharacterized protein n=1 Tax=Azorhizobium oxalatiphilum TaxID=980631 RepID=A0A917F6N8_9HYPH|nr:hypothetical protein [Azorhizobium oxalatiphilum]GGF52936.1 hypothetical protein GCM10007301_10530 [Azorhizobium oxalatiphilum]
MSCVVPFPTEHPRTRAAVTGGASAQIYILPVVRIERHPETELPMPKVPMPRKHHHPLAPFFSGGDWRAR